MASIHVNSFIRFGFMVVGMAGAATGIKYIYTIHFSDTRDKNEHLVPLAAITLSSELVNRTLSDLYFRRTLSQFGMRLLLHQDTLGALKAFAITEFTQDTPTRAALRSFVVNDIIRDPWVKEELIELVKDVATDIKEDHEISRNKFLSCLCECSIASLNSSSLSRDLKTKLTRASWEALMGPPPIGGELVPSLNGMFDSPKFNIMPNNNSNEFGDPNNSLQLITAQRGRKVYRVRGQRFDIEDTYTITSVVGHGAYGVVCAALDDQTFQGVAIKHVNHVFEDLMDGRRIWREVLLLRLLKENGCRNILNLIRILPSKVGITEFDDLYMVTDLYDVDFHSIIRQRKAISFDVLRKVTVHVLRCLEDMHSLGVVHRDIKPSNILLKMDRDIETVVVCDFGLARGGLNELKDPVYLTDYVVTRWYRAPEVLLMALYGFPVDIWALGCVMAEYIMQRPLFDGRDYIHQMQLVLSTVPITGTDFIERDCDTAIPHLLEIAKRYGNTRPLSRLLSSIPKDGLNLISKMLAFEPNKRITAQAALRHSFLESVEGSETKHLSSREIDFSLDMHTDVSECQLRRAIWNEIQHYIK